MKFTYQTLNLIYLKTAYPFRRNQLPITLQLGTEIPGHSSFHVCSVFVNAVTITVSSYVKLPCCDQEILFTYSGLVFNASSSYNFLPILPHRSLNPGRRWCNIYVSLGLSTPFSTHRPIVGLCDSYHLLKKGTSLVMAK